MWAGGGGRNGGRVRPVVSVITERRRKEDATGDEWERETSDGGTCWKESVGVQGTDD